jgi:hypothetical protein
VLMPACPLCRMSDAPQTFLDEVLSRVSSYRLDIQRVSNCTRIGPCRCSSDACKEACTTPPSFRCGRSERITGILPVSFLPLLSQFARFILFPLSLTIPFPLFLSLRYPMPVPSIFNACIDAEVLPDAFGTRVSLRPAPYPSVLCTSDFVCVILQTRLTNSRSTDLCRICTGRGLGQEGCLLGCALCGQTMHPFCLDLPSSVDTVALQQSGNWL